jgi:hypothetical protein
VKKRSLRYTILACIFLWIVIQSAASTAETIVEDVAQVFTADVLMSFIISESFSMVLFIVLVIAIGRWLFGNATAGKGLMTQKPVIVLIVVYVTVHVVQFCWVFWLTGFFVKFAKPPIDFESYALLYARMALANSILFYVKIIILSLIILIGFKKLDAKNFTNAA